MNTLLPNEFYKQAVRGVCFRYRPVSKDTDQDFYQYLERNYRECLDDLNNATDDVAVTGTKDGVFVFAAGLLAYGRSETVFDILNNIPSSGEVRRLASVVTALMPIPESLDVFNDTVKVVEWLEQNLARLSWNPALGKYELP